MKSKITWDKIEFYLILIVLSIIFPVVGCIVAMWLLFKFTALTPKEQDEIDEWRDMTYVERRKIKRARAKL